MHATSSMSQKGGTSGGKAKENRAVCTLHTTLSTKERIQDGVWDAHHLVIALPILPAYSLLLAAAPVPPSYYPMRHLTRWHGVIWVIRNQWHWVAGGVVGSWWRGSDVTCLGRVVVVVWRRWHGIGGWACHCHWRLVMWHWWESLLASLGGLASLGAGWCGDMTLMEDRGINELTLVWPNIGQSPGCLTAAVLAICSGGGGEKCSTFQCPTDSCRNDRIPAEWHRNPQEWPESAGMASEWLDSSRMAPEWNRNSSHRTSNSLNLPYLI